MDEVLRVSSLSVDFKGESSEIHAVRDVSFTLRKGETLGIVGESGCGKSVTSLAIMGLLPVDKAAIKSGEVIYDGRDLLRLSKSEMRLLIGKELTMIFQDPISALDPLFTIESQIIEGMQIHLGMKKKQARDLARSLLEDVGMRDVERALKSYPHQLSGGMIQRVMVSIGLACNPNVLIADEPTTALDVTVQAQVLELMNRLKRKYHSSVVLISHNMGVIAEMCDRVLVMYAGEVVEEIGINQLFEKPTHPYTRGLLDCIPRLTKKVEVLPSIPGTLPSAGEEFFGCLFSPRCHFCNSRCENERPLMLNVEEGHRVRCHLYEGEAV